MQTERKIEVNVEYKGRRQYCFPYGVSEIFRFGCLALLTDSSLGPSYNTYFIAIQQSQPIFLFPCSWLNDLLWCSWNLIGFFSLHFIFFLVPAQCLSQICQCYTVKITKGTTSLLRPVGAKLAGEVGMFKNDGSVCSIHRHSFCSGFLNRASYSVTERQKASSGFYSYWEGNLCI